MYGLLIGRFQPFHLGHYAILREIEHDGLIPYVIIGSSQIDYASRTFKNPLTYHMRSDIISEVEGNYFGVPDHASDEEWWKHIESELAARNIDINYCKLYHGNKFCDWVENFTLFGKDYDYCHLYDGLPIEKVIPKFPKKLGLEYLHASTIRDTPKKNRHFISKLAYDLLTESLADLQETHLTVS